MFKQKEHIFYGWWVLIGCITINAVIFPFMFSLSTIFTQNFNNIIEGPGRTNTLHYGLAMFIPMAIGMVFSTFFAKFIKHIDIRKIMIIFIIGEASAYASMTFVSYAHSWYALIASAFFIGFFFQHVCATPTNKIIMNWFSRRRGLALSLNMAGLAIGGSLFTVIFGLMNDHLSQYFQFFYLVIAVLIAGICLPIAIFVIRSKPEEKGLSPYGDKKIRIHIHENKAKRESKIYNRLYFSNALRPIGKLNGKSITKLFFWLLIIGIFLAGISDGIINFEFPYAFLNGNQIIDGSPTGDIDYPGQYWMYIIAIISILGIVTKFFQGIINDKWGFEATLIASAILPIIGMVILVCGYHSVSSLLIFAVLMGLGGIGSSLPYLLTAAIYGKENNSKGSAIVNNFIVGGQVISAVGLFARLGNSYHVMWWILLAILIVTPLFMLCSYLSSRKYAKNSQPEKLDIIINY